MSADQKTALRALELVRTITQDDADAFTALIGAILVCANDSGAFAAWLGTAMSSIDAARRRGAARATSDASGTLAESDTLLIQRLSARNAQLERELDELRCGDLVAFQGAELPMPRAEKFRDHLSRCLGCQQGLRELMQMEIRLSESARPR